MASFCINKMIILEEASAAPAISSVLNFVSVVAVFLIFIVEEKPRILVLTTLFPSRFSRLEVPKGEEA
jgi:hypothetical protein